MISSCLTLRIIIPSSPSLTLRVSLSNKPPGVLSVRFFELGNESSKTDLGIGCMLRDRGEVPILLDPIYNLWVDMYS